MLDAFTLRAQQGPPLNEAEAQLIAQLLEIGQA